MEQFKQLDNEEIILLISGAFSLFFIFSYSINFFKVILGFNNYTETGIKSLFFIYINCSMWYYYSVLIEHELMQGCYYYGSWIAFAMLILYLSYQYYDDKFDTLLNFLITSILFSTLKKIFIQIYDDEEKTKRFCGYTQFLVIISIIQWIYKSYKTKNIRNLNIYVAFGLIFYSSSLLYYGYSFEDLYILIPNFGGVLIGLAYICIWCLLNKKYDSFEIELQGAPSIDIEVKDEKKVKEKSDKKNKKRNEEEKNNLK